MGALDQAIRRGDLATADAELAKGAAMTWMGYWGALLEAQNTEADHTIQWYQKKINHRDIQSLFFPDAATFSALAWVGQNARVYRRNPKFDACALALMQMASVGGVINDPVVRPVCDAPEHARSAPEGWRLLHFAAAAKNLPMMEALLELGAHPDGFDRSVLAQAADKGRFANWAWAIDARRPPDCPPALLCADFPEGLAALAKAGADFSLLGRPKGSARAVSIMERSLPFIAQRWRAGRDGHGDALALARFWLDRAAPADLARFAHEKDLSPAEGMLRLKGLGALADSVFPKGEGGALDRLRFDLAAFERQRGRKCVAALRERDFFALSAELRSAAASGAPLESWTVAGRHIFILALSFCAALPERSTQETLHGAGSDRDQQAAALIDLALELGGPRAVFEPFAKEPGALAHYCALGFGLAANQACSRAAPEAALGAPMRLVENPLNWALWSENEAALDAWGKAGACSPAFISLFPSSRHPMELAFERGRLDACLSLARAGVSLEPPSSTPGRSIRDLFILDLESGPGALAPERAQALREILAAAERSDLDRAAPEPAPRPRSRSL